MVYVTWALSITAMVITLYLAFHKEHRDDDNHNAERDKSLTVAIAKIDGKQDMIISSINELRLDQRTQNQRLNDIEQRVAGLEQSVKIAHTRLDNIDKGGQAHV